MLLVKKAHAIITNLTNLPVTMVRREVGQNAVIGQVLLALLTLPIELRASLVLIDKVAKKDEQNNTYKISYLNKY